MSGSARYPSYTTCVARALSAAPRALDVDELLTEVASERPVGRAARGYVERALDELFQAVPVGSGRYGWLSHLLGGSVISHPLTDEEVGGGTIQLDELEHSVFFPQFFQDYEADDRAVELTLFGGPALRVEPVIRRKVWSLPLGPEFVAWLAELGVEKQDDLLITVLDAEQGRYELRARLRQMRDEDAIEKRNIRLALLAERIVAEDSRTRPYMPTWELVARLIGLGFFRETPPPDDMHSVLHEYGMLRLADGLGYQIEGATTAKNARKAWGRGPTPEQALDALADWAFRFFVEDDDEEGAEVGGAERTGADRDISFPEDAPYLEGLPDDDVCWAYEEYLNSYEQDSAADAPLEHDEFHMLEAELDMFLQLETEFGGLLPEQESRKQALAKRLYIDPDDLANMGWEMPDDPSPDEPPFWSN